MSFKIGFLFLVPADLALLSWLKVEIFLNDLTYGKPSSRVVPPHTRSFFATLHTRATYSKVDQLNPI